MRSRDDLRILGQTDTHNRVATISIRPNRPAKDIAADLADRKIMAGAGNFYAVRLLEALNIPTDPGVLRLSFVHYTNQREIFQLIDGLDVTL